MITQKTTDTKKIQKQKIIIATVMSARINME